MLKYLIHENLTNSTDIFEHIENSPIVISKKSGLVTRLAARGCKSEVELGMLPMPNGLHHQHWMKTENFASNKK